jgi:hypothetical protein
MYVLDAAALRARFGSAGLWCWRIVRYLRLRWPRHDTTDEEEDR